MSTVDEVLLGSTDTSDEFLRMLLSSIALTTTHVNEINTNTGTSTNSNSVSDVKASSSTNTIEESCNYYKRNNSEIRNVTIVNKASSLIQKIANYCKTEHSIQLPDNYSDPLFYEKIVEIVEVLVEKADDNLRKIRKDELDRDNQGSDRKISELVTQSLLNDHERLIQSHIVHLEKPQLKFHQDIDNSRNNPFKPKLLKKYHFIQPFKLVELAVENSEDDVECPSTYYAHPYEAELLGLEYPPSQLTDMSKAAMPTTTSLEQTLELIFDENDFVEMLQDLASEKEIAVALKQHNLRSFQGFTCLMQISTRNKDYIIDTIKLRSMIRHLGNIFDNPQVLKVFNNAENDILCLQRDFGIYVVNCFDTLFAAKLLKYPTLSIAHLVKYHCGLVISSRHQLSDWRKRPLGDDMLAYARSDTCYLLYIYDCLRIDLWKAAGKEGLDSVLEASKKLCLERYEKPFFYPAGFQELFIGANRGQKRNLTLEDYSTTQEAVLTALWNWRDATARKDDESAVYIMSNSELIRISTALPTSLPDLERCSPLSNATRAYNQDILQLIKEQISSHSSKFGLNISINSSNNSLYKSDVRKSKEKPLLSSSFSFTPVVALPDKSKSTEESCARRKSDASPELAPDEIFKLAGWSTPAVKPDRDHLSYSPFAFASFKSSEPSEESKAKLAKAKDELNSRKFNDSRKKFENQLNDLASQEPLKLSPRPSADLWDTLNKNDRAVSPELIINSNPISIPNSYEEIYKISQKNRLKNKEKKRFRDHEDDNALAGDSVADSITEGVTKTDTSSVASSLQSLPDNLEGGDTWLKSHNQSMDQIYFTKLGQPVDCSLDGTLDFAKSVGWLKDKKQINAIRNAYQSAENIVSGDENHSSEGVKKEEGKSSHPSGKTTPKISTKKKAATQSQQKSHIQPASTIKINTLAESSVTESASNYPTRGDIPRIPSGTTNNNSQSVTKSQPAIAPGLGGAIHRGSSSSSSSSK